MIILIDTDVLIDTALNHTPHADTSSALLDALENQHGAGIVSWHTLSNYFYLVAPMKRGPETRDYLEELSRFIQVAPTTTESWRYACRLPMKNFEDAMQVAAAVAGRADVIATRNIRDYTNSPIRALTPQAAYSRIARVLTRRSRTGHQWFYVLLPPQQRLRPSGLTKQPSSVAGPKPGITNTRLDRVVGLTDKTSFTAQRSWTRRIKMDSRLKLSGMTTRKK